MNRKSSFDEILAVCLEELATRPGGLDATLARYPQMADELRPLLEAAQWLTYRAPSLDPRPGFVASSLPRLVREIKRAPTRATFWDKLLGTHNRPIMVPIAISLVILTFFISALGGRSLSANAVSALPGEALYPVKTALEDLQLVASLSDEGDARLYVQFADRRINEIEQIILSGETEYLDQAIARYERQTEAAIQLVEAVAAMDTERGIELSRWMEVSLEQQNTTLALMMEISPSAASSSFERMMATNAANRKTMHEIVTTLETTEPTRAIPTPAGASPKPPAEKTATRLPPGQNKTQPAGVATEKPTNDAKATKTDKPTSTPKPTDDPKATKTDKPTSTPKPTNDAKATKTDKPTSTPKPTDEAKATSTDKPTDEPKPTKEEKATDVPAPTEAPQPTDVPAPTDEPKPTKEDKPTKEP